MLHDGIPVFTGDLDRIEHDDVGGCHSHAKSATAKRSNAQKAGQAEYFDQVDAEEFEISRPHGSPELYAFLINEKLHRATAALAHELNGATALIVCGGSGMEADFLARAGASVVSSDISLGAARRARARAQRYGLAMVSIVADVERLPFSTGSFDLVLVHDGLHHLEQPERGLMEMARVSRRWISVTEPAAAAVTRLAVRLGLAQDEEDSGNRVARLTLSEVQRVLTEAGFQPVSSGRYAMYYRHQPGRISSALSMGAVLPVVRVGWRLANAAVGRFGNKMVVVGRRE